VVFSIASHPNLFPSPGKLFDKDKGQMATCLRVSLPLLLLACLLLTPRSPQAADEKPVDPKTVLVIHGGAGGLTEEEMKKEGLRREGYEKALDRALNAGYQAWKKGTSVDAVEEAIRVMEDSGLFNAGRGAAFTSDGRVELDAAIMEGKMTVKGEGKRDPRKRAGAVTG